MKWTESSFVTRAEVQARRVKVPLAHNLDIVDLGTSAFKKAEEDYVGAFAAGLAYKGIFATFLFVVFLLSLLGVFRASDLVNTLLDRLSMAMPEAVTVVIRSQVDNVRGQRSGSAFTLSAVVAVLAALWGISGAFRYAMQALNVMYKVRDRRPLWRQYLVSLLLSFAVTALTISAALLVAFGPGIGSRIGRIVGMGPLGRWTLNVLQWPVLIGLMLLAFALVYYYAPDVEQEFRFITPGSFIGVGLWLLFSMLFLLFVETLGTYNRLYGAVAGVAIHMFYMYYFSYILLFGAEINQIVEANHPDGKDPGERTADDGD